MYPIKIYQTLSSLQTFRLKINVSFSICLWVLHAPPILYFSILDALIVYGNNVIYKVLHYVISGTLVFSIGILFMASSVHVTKLAQNILTCGTLKMISGNRNAFILTFCLNEIQYGVADKGITVRHSPLSYRRLHVLPISCC
jgi:hypothetical protein